MDTKCPIPFSPYNHRRASFAAPRARHVRLYLRTPHYCARVARVVVDRMRPQLVR